MDVGVVMLNSCLVNQDSSIMFEEKRKFGNFSIIVEEFLENTSLFLSYY